MKIEFHYYNRKSRIPHISVSFIRDVSVVPRIGEKITHHQNGVSITYKVKDVLHVYEDREWYQKNFGTESVLITLLEQTQEEASKEFDQILEASGCSK